MHADQKHHEGEEKGNVIQDKKNVAISKAKNSLSCCGLQKTGHRHILPNQHLTQASETMVSCVYQSEGVH